MSDETALLTSSQVAERFLVHISTVSRWVRDGKLEAIRTPGGHIRFRRVDVDALFPGDPSEKAAS